MPEEKKQDFASTGTEAYKIAGPEKNKDRVVLTIEEEKPSGLLLAEKKLKGEITGNVFIDYFNKINKFFIEHSKVKIKDKSTFFHLLSVMINSGIPMIKALNSLALQMEKTPKLQMIIDDIAKNIEGGLTLSASLAKHPEVFLDQEIGMIESGEASGQLSGVLENLAADTEKAYSIRSKVKSAMMYPIVVFILLIGVIAAMMIFVIPGLKELFEGSGAELPLITRIVVGISDFMVNRKFLLIGIIVVLIVSMIIFKRTKIGTYVFDQFKIKVPIFGKLFKQAYLSRFARSLSNLLDSNISIVKAVEITGNSIGNEVYKRRLLISMEDIKQGIPLAESIAESPLFPPMLINMIDVGEKTAQLDTISKKVAIFYENEVDTAVAGISKIIEPVILVIIGLSVGAVVAAIMMPIMQLSNLAGSL